MRRRHSSHNSALLGADASVRAARFLRAAQRAKRLDGRWSGGYPLQTPACSNRRPGGFVSELIALFSWEIGIVSPYCRIRAAKMATMTFNSKYNFKAVVSHVQVENDSEEPTHLVLLTVLQYEDLPKTDNVLLFQSDLLGLFRDKEHLLNRIKETVSSEVQTDLERALRNQKTFSFVLTASLAELRTLLGRDVILEPGSIIPSREFSVKVRIGTDR